MISLRALTTTTAQRVDDVRARLAAVHADDAIVRQLTQRRRAICAESPISWAYRLLHSGVIKKT